MSKQSVIDFNKNNLSLFEQWQKDKNPKIKQQLLVQNTGLINRHAFRLKQSSKTSCPIEDLFQEGAIGFLKGFDKFDPTMNTAFTTYISYWIMSAILLEIKKSFLLRIARSNNRKKAIVAINRDSFKFIDDDGNIDFAKLSEYSNVPVEVLKSIEQALNTETVYDSGNGIFDDDQFSIQESFLYGKILSPQDLLEKKEKIELIKLGINNILKELPTKVKINRLSLYEDVIQYRIYPSLYDDALFLTQEQIAEKNGYGPVKQVVEPVEKQILESLQKKVHNATWAGRGWAKTNQTMVGQPSVSKT